MSFSPLARLRGVPERLFRERHLHLRSGETTRSLLLGPRRQMLIAAALVVSLGWMGVATAAMIDGAWRATHRPSPAAPSAGVDQGAALQALADRLQRRDEALALLLAKEQNAPGPLATPRPAQGPPAARLAAIDGEQDRLADAAGSAARDHADRLRRAFHLAGLNPGAYAGPARAMGGPLIDVRDSRTLAALLQIDATFAGRVGRAAQDLAADQSLRAAAAALPLARPTDHTTQSSGFGFRTDPFTGETAFHPGLDFAGPRMTPVRATAPGVVVFAGQRSGYGGTVEIDHGHGFKTRYGHLQSLGVHVGQRVSLGEKIGAMGSTGRSTGDHLHYEVWLNGRVQNPLRFVKAGDYVQQS